MHACMYVCMYVCMHTRMHALLHSTADAAVRLQLLNQTARSAFVHIYIYIYEDETLISLDQQAEGKTKNWPGGP